MSTSERARRAVLVLGGGAVAAGLLGVIVGWSTGASAQRSKLVGFPQHELGVWSFNVVGALAVAGLGALAIAGVLLGRPIVVRLSAAGFALLAVQVLAQAGRHTNWFGSRGSNLGLAIGLSAGLWGAGWAWAQGLSVGSTASAGRSISSSATQTVRENG